MTHQDLSVPVIAIDGGAGTGKGTARALVAQALGFNSLDSGVLYRALGITCSRRAVMDTQDIVAAAETMKLEFVGEVILLDGVDDTITLRSDTAGALASKVGAIAEVRAALLDFQLRMRVAPGLVVDGRDQGFIFDTPYRYFFTCAPEVRARRRLRQLEEFGHPTMYETVLAEINRRDEADRTRAVQPLKPHPEALIIDTSEITIDQMVETVLADYRSRQ